MRFSAPSSSRTLRLTSLRAMYSSDVRPTRRSCSSAFLRMAMRVSRSGGWMSAMSPHSKRDRSRSSMRWISFGGRSLDEDDLLLSLVERVERVEELLLRPLLARDELDVVDEEHVALRYRCGTPSIRSLRMRVDQLVHELLVADVGHVRAAGCAAMTQLPMACSRCVLPRPTPP